ncbi:MAG TPA: ASCH domain-containing protein [Gaiellaceae bacterium]|jgi:uncharacterized protein YhfF|nr:ASCH domain-containing protein [Gaiellaceae bacterium]
METAEFAFPGELRDRLVAAILRGEKTSTTGLYAEYEEEGERIPDPGTQCLVVDSDGRGVAVIELTSVDVVRIKEIELQFALDEGEGFNSVAEWRAAHEEFWASYRTEAIDDDTLVVAERFRLVSRLDPPPR